MPGLLYYFCLRRNYVEASSWRKEGPYSLPGPPNLSPRPMFDGLKFPYLSERAAGSTEVTVN